MTLSEQEIMSDSEKVPLLAMFTYVRSVAECCNVVVNGTILTEDHIKIIKKYGYDVEVIDKDVDIKYKISWN